MLFGNGKRNREDVCIKNEPPRPEGRDTTPRIKGFIPRCIFGTRSAVESRIAKVRDCRPLV